MTTPQDGEPSTVPSTSNTNTGTSPGNPYSSPVKVIQSPKEDLDAIQTSLTARRRMSLRSLLNSYKSQNAALKGKSNIKPHDEVLVEDEEDVNAGTTEGVDEEGEGDHFDPATRVNTADLKAYNEAKGKAINILKMTSEGIRTGIKNVEDEVEVGFQKEYVWDVLFENQRGIYIFGKGYFSAGGLLPADPSAFTRPSTAIPSASSLGKGKGKGKKKSNDNSEPGTTSTTTKTNVNGDEDKDKNNGKGTSKSRSNKTSYTLDTYQPPLPDWEYLTPWMINMRIGTDELGWRYNAWFKKKGWSSHSGTLGWGGWVRRREWIRLRGVGVDTRKDSSQVEVHAEERDKLEKKGRSLRDVLCHENVGENVQEILVSMGKINLDRQRLELWEKWLVDLSIGDNKNKNRQMEECRERLRNICEDEQALNDLRKQFTYPTSSFPSFLKILSSHSIAYPASFDASTPQHDSQNDDSTNSKNQDCPSCGTT